MSQASPNVHVDLILFFFVVSYLCLQICIVAAEGAAATPGGQLLDPQQLAHMGDHFIKVLMTMKHNGAVDKTQAGFIDLVRR